MQISFPEKGTAQIIVISYEAWQVLDTIWWPSGNLFCNLETICVLFLNITECLDSLDVRDMLSLKNMCLAPRWTPWVLLISNGKDNLCNRHRKTLQKQGNTRTLPFALASLPLKDL